MTLSGGAAFYLGVLGAAGFPIAGLLWLAFRLPSKPCFGNDKRNGFGLRLGFGGFRRVFGLRGPDCFVD